MMNQTGAILSEHPHMKPQFESTLPAGQVNIQPSRIDRPLSPSRQSKQFSKK